MTSSDFTTWLRGYLAGCEAKRPTPAQWAEIRARLGEVADATVSLQMPIITFNPGMPHPCPGDYAPPAYGPAFAVPPAPGLPTTVITCGPDGMRYAGGPAHGQQVQYAAPLGTAGRTLTGAFGMVPSGSTVPSVRPLPGQPGCVEKDGRCIDSALAAHLDAEKARYR